MVTCPECIEEGVTRPRPVADGATRGRCTTHWRAIKKARRAATRDKRVVRIYGLEPGEYGILKAAQGGKCAICQKATGKSKALAVDHDHVTGLVRGLLCGVCNQMLGQMTFEAFARAMAYLMNPPAQRVLGDRFFKGPS